MPVMLEHSEEEADVVHAGATAAAEAADDMGLRESVVDSLAAATEVVSGCPAVGLVSGSPAQSLHDAAPVCDSAAPSVAEPT